MLLTLFLAIAVHKTLLAHGMTAEDAKHGNMHRNLKWARQSTIGHGAPCCDFHVSKLHSYQAPKTL